MKKLVLFSLFSLLLFPFMAQSQDSTTVIYSTTIHQSTWSAFVIADKYPQANLINVATLDTGDVDALIAGISDSSQMRIFVTLPVVAHSATVDQINEYQITALDFKLEHGPDTGMIYETGNTASPVKNPIRQTWDAIYVPTVGRKCYPSAFLNLLGGYKIGLIDNMTATSFTDTSVTKTAAGWTVNAYAGKYIWIVSATTGKGQYAVIKSNSATRIIIKASDKTYLSPDNVTYPIVATSGAFSPSLSGTVVFSVVNDYPDCFKQIYALNFAECYWTAPSSSTQMTWFKRLCNYGGTATSNKSAIYDPVYFKNALQYGKVIYDNEILHP